MKAVSVQVTDLSKRIGRKQILKQVNFKMQPGHILGLLGPNGAGKTTTIRLMVGLIAKSGGTVTVLGQNIDQHLTEALAHIGTIIETPQFYDYMTGYQNLQQYARASRPPVSKERIDAVVAKVKLTAAIQRKVKTYSLGMRQRLGIAQAILARPAVLLLDEPMNGLDPAGDHDFRVLMQELAAQQVSILISSHILSDIEKLADDLVVLKQGEVVYAGTLAALQARQNAKLILETDNPAQTALVLRHLQLDFTQTKQHFEIPMTTDIRPEVTKALGDAGIGLLTLAKQEVSLEDAYLQLVGEA
ncbi:ABC transporter, ATP-binding protein [Lactobacillus selangorensis]|uniref:ABC transporter, ATP-binding protein n=1 Tax=Lactobacillus selangorensis TaxID=81857 RepID=A0A0R2FT29_9LACO|nr:ABC transporter ATP-binding protein [Lactobacillus selangorensis]KRN27933.1 ABC transporter, ATP-binding protein [Lactobacillus selangorensis]KRN30596.1 ABC transporter, ATP-binding protein [Lactobacillus selangorensis]